MENIFLGKWHITEMEHCSNETLNKTEQAFIEFDSNSRGQFLFCTVEAIMDYRIYHRNDNLRLEFSFEGIEDNRQVSGRGWLQVNGDKMLGHIYFYKGKDTQFVAQRVMNVNKSSHMQQNPSHTAIY